MLKLIVVKEHFRWIIAKNAFSLRRIATTSAGVTIAPATKC